MFEPPDALILAPILDKSAGISRRIGGFLLHLTRARMSPRVAGRILVGGVVILPGWQQP